MADVQAAIRCLGFKLSGFPSPDPVLSLSSRFAPAEPACSTTNRQPADGLAGLPRDYTGPVLGPPLPGDLGRPIVDAQNRGQPVVPPTMTTPRVDEAEQRRMAEEEAARSSPAGMRRITVVQGRDWEVSMRKVNSTLIFGNRRWIVMRFEMTSGNPRDAQVAFERLPVPLG